MAIIMTMTMIMVIIVVAMIMMTMTIIPMVIKVLITNHLGESIFSRNFLGIVSDHSLARNESGQVSRS